MCDAKYKCLKRNDAMPQVDESPAGVFKSVVDEGGVCAYNTKGLACRELASTTDIGRRMRKSSAAKFDLLLVLALWSRLKAISGIGMIETSVAAASGVGGNESLSVEDDRLRLLPCRPGDEDSNRGVCWYTPASLDGDEGSNAYSD